MKYIDAEKAKNSVMEFVDEHGEIVGMFVNDFNILLERCAADVEEVRHGMWIEADDDGVMHKCSVCGEWSCCRSPYCGECGAKMVNEDE